MDLKAKLREIIFGYHTKTGKLFDIILIFAILGSLVIVMLDSVAHIHQEFDHTLNALEWFFTIIFTIEYIARVYSAEKPWAYIFSFYGIIDLLSTIPSYLAIIIPGSETILILRVFRLMRIFRIFKLGHYVKGSQILVTSLYENRGKIISFLVVVLIVVIFIGSLMYIIEGPEHGFNSIPRSMYWAIVTVTTVGFGDISPETSVGQFLASLLMLTGYAIIAVPTGIVSSGILRPKFVKEKKTPAEKQARCPQCQSKINVKKDNYCKKCGNKLIE